MAFPGQKVTIVRNEIPDHTAELRVTMSDSGTVWKRKQIPSDNQVDVGPTEFKNGDDNPSRPRTVNLFIRGPTGGWIDTGKHLSPDDFILYAKIIIKRDNQNGEDFIEGVKYRNDFGRRRGVRLFVGGDEEPPERIV